MFIARNLQVDAHMKNPLLGLKQKVGVTLKW